MRLAAAAVVAVGLAPTMVSPTLASADSTCTYTYTDTATTCTFEYTGAAQTWTAPSRVTRAIFDVYGAGGGGASEFNADGGKGGRVYATLDVTPGATYQVWVGRKAAIDSWGAAVGSGDASDVRGGTFSLNERLLVAGGGGGGGYGYHFPGGRGGDGGYPVGGAGQNGTSVNGGKGGAGGGQSATAVSCDLVDANLVDANLCGRPGTPGIGGSGGGGLYQKGGHGGGGYYGGTGGNGADGDAGGGGGGGGGSSFGPASATFQSGAQAGNGKVVISWGPTSIRRLDLVGKHIRSTGDYWTVYLIDVDGTKRRINDDLTWGLFRDSTGIIEMDDDAIRPITTGEDLGGGDEKLFGQGGRVSLARAYSWETGSFTSDQIYLVERGRKRLVTSAVAMDKFGFNPNRIGQLSQRELDWMSNGPDVSAPTATVLAEPDPSNANGGCTVAFYGGHEVAATASAAGTAGPIFDVPPTSVALWCLNVGELANARITVAGPNGEATTGAAPTKQINGWAWTVGINGTTGGAYVISYTADGGPGAPPPVSYQGTVRFSVRDPLKVTASSPTITYPAAVPAITPSYSDFVNNDTEAVLDTKPTCTAAVPTPLSAGTFTTSCAGAVDPSYPRITYVPGTLTINKAATSLTLRSDKASVDQGQPVTFTATVAAPGPGAAKPTGGVSFTYGANAIRNCSAVPTLDPTTLAATCTVSNLTLGSHTINARYVGDTNYLGVSAPSLAVTVKPVDPPTTTTISNVSASPSFNARPVTFTASVAVVAPGTGTPGGTVTFFDGTASLGTGQLQLVGGKPQATLTTYSLPMGKHVITARYDGALHLFAPSTSTPVEHWVSVDPATLPRNSSTGGYNLRDRPAGVFYALNLANSVLQGNLTNAIFIRADLTSATLTSMQLTGTDFSLARLNNATIGGSSLRGANFTGADLTGVLFTHVDLTGATGLNEAVLTNVTWVSTVCPDGTTSTENRGTCIGHL